MLKVLSPLEESQQNFLANQLEHLRLTRGFVTMNIINKTNITSTNGVTFISLIGSFEERLNLNAILNYCEKSFEKFSNF